MRARGLASVAPLAFACASPACAQDSVEAAQQALAAGDPEQAIAILQPMVDRAPGNADLLRRLAVAQAAGGNFATALATIDRAVAIAPLDNDIRLARGRILLWSGRTDEAAAEAERVAAIAPDYPDLAALQQAIAARRSVGGLNYGLALSSGVSRIRFENGNSSTWYNSTLSGFGQIDPATTLTGTVNHEDRTRSDTRLSLRANRRVGKANIYLEGSATPHADFRERWGIAGGGEASLSHAVDALLDVRHAAYSTNSVTVVQPGLRVRPVEAIAITGRWINLFQSGGDYRSGASARIDFDLGQERGIYAGGATYPDTEAGVTRRVHAVFAGAALPISAQATLRLAAEYERRDLSYTRRAVTLGFAWRWGG